MNQEQDHTDKTDHPDDSETQVPRLFTTKEVADLLQVSERHVSNLSKKEEFPKPIRLGRSVRYLPSDVSKWFDRESARRNDPNNGPSLAG